jgi:DNA mismatch repair protein MutL
MGDLLEKTREIIKLSPITISRIAAGEVVDRPASVIKELIENSLDAGSSEITIKIEDIGRGLISVSDNGCGMDAKNLALAVQSHTTSKLKDNDLINIESLGFRGEAIASIASVSRLNITTRSAHLTDGSSIMVVGGQASEVMPAPHHVGTTVEIRDLFFAMPARLKFLKADRTEHQHIENIIKKIAIAHPKVEFKFYADGKLILNYVSADLIDARTVRISEVLGKAFIENSIEINRTSEFSRISGYICLPTYARSTYTEQYLYVNGRAVRDKLLLIYTKTAYQDFLGHDKHPMTVLFIDIPTEFVDVNVHPAKTEVRFRDSFGIKSLVIGSLKKALEENSMKTSSTIGTAAIELMANRREAAVGNLFKSMPSYSGAAKLELNETIHTLNAPRPYESQRSFIDQSYVEESQVKEPQIQQELISDTYPLGTAKAQLHQTYIVSQTHDGIVIVDQHAAHERIRYERLKNQLEECNVEVQRLLVPELIEVDNLEIQDKLLQMRDYLLRSGLKIEYHAKNIIKVTEMPHLLRNCDIKELIEKIINNVLDLEDDANVSVFTNKILSTYACHASIRAGDEMRREEMDKLLREMEETQSIGQCNHGRPTYIKLALNDIKKLFERS